MTITRVGTNAKYSTGWDAAFGGKKAKKDAGASAGKQKAAQPKMLTKAKATTKPKAVAVSAAKPASVKPAAAKAKATAKPVTKSVQLAKPAAKPAAKAGKSKAKPVAAKRGR